MEKLHISPEMPERDVVEDTRDGFNTTSPLSPMSDDDGKLKCCVVGSRSAINQIPAY